MIHTLTLNPTLDLTYLVDEFLDDDTTRAHTVYRAPGGKGINVSRVATRLGHPTVALGFMGGRTGLEVVELLEAEGVNTWFTPITGNTRTNPIVQDRNGKQLRVSAPGPSVDERGVKSVWASVFALRPPDFVLASGSRLNGVPEDFYLRLVARAASEGVKAVVDADGEELRRGVEAGAYLIKPNRHELERLSGRKLPALDDVVSACRDVLGAGVRVVAASLGADGAVLVRADGAWRAMPPAIRVNSPVGAGDSFLAGLLVKLAENADPLEALRFGVACGTAAAMTPGTSLCAHPDVLEVLARVGGERLA